MEPSHFNSGTQTAAAGNADNDPAVPGPSGVRPPRNSSDPDTSTSSSISQTSNTQPQPTTSHSQNLITPSRIFSVGRKPPSSIRGTQTTESRKHKSELGESSRTNEKRLKRNDSGNPSSESNSSRESSPQNQNSAPPAESGAADVNPSSAVDDQRVLVVNLERLSPERLPSSAFSNSYFDESLNLPRYRAGRFKRRMPGLDNSFFRSKFLFFIWLLSGKILMEKLLLQLWVVDIPM